MRAAGYARVGEALFEWWSRASKAPD
jgi:hypothetical protein